MPVELVKLLQKFRDLFDYVRDFSLQKYETGHVAYDTMARYFASLFPYVFIHMMYPYWMVIGCQIRIFITNED